MNSPAQPEASTPEKNTLPAERVNRKLTLAQKKLAGSERCLNCNTALQGPFCYYCGQPDRNFLRFFPALLRDMMEDLVDFDSRFMRTLKPLLFKPGRLTKDFMSGRRFRYTPPMRLYIFSSIVFFLLAALFSSNQLNVQRSVNADGETDVMFSAENSEQDKQKLEHALKVLPPELREEIVADLTQPAPPEKAVQSTQSQPADEPVANEDAEQTLAVSDGNDDSSNQESQADEIFKPGDISFNGEPWNRETNPIDIAFLPDWLNDRLNDEVENSPKKAQQIEENPNLMVEKVLDLLPATMFVLLPIVALIFKFWYLFAKRYYVEHLIFSLHNHAFVFVCLTFVLTMNEASSLLVDRGMTGLYTTLEWLEIAIWSWIPIYMLISLRVVYQQNWAMTALKFVLIGISYLTLLGIVSVGVAVAGFILL